MKRYLFGLMAASMAFAAQAESVGGFNLKDEATFLKEYGDHAVQVAKGVYKIQTRTPGSEIRVSFGNDGLAYERSLIEAELGALGRAKALAPGQSEHRDRLSKRLADLPQPDGMRSKNGEETADGVYCNNKIYWLLQTAAVATPGGNNYAYANAYVLKNEGAPTDNTNRTVRVYAEAYGYNTGWAISGPIQATFYYGNRQTGSVDAPLDFCGYTHADNEEWLAASGCSSTYVSAHYTDDPCNIHASIGR